MAYVVDPEITALQIKVYDCVREGWKHAGMGPTQREVATALLCSIEAVRRAYKNLRKNGHITVRKFEERGAKPVDPKRWIIRDLPAPWDEPLADRPGVYFKW